MKKRIFTIILTMLTTITLLVVVRFRIAKIENYENEVFSQGVEDEPFAALRFRYEMLSGKDSVVEPNSRRKAIAYTKEVLLKKNLSKEGTNEEWYAVGPGNIGGRIREILMRPGNPDEMLAGSVSGGVWKTTDAGKSWFPVNDDGFPIAIGCMVNIGDTVYAGTGEAWGNEDAVYGGGIWMSPDFGETWHLLESTVTINNGWAFKNVRVLKTDTENNLYAITFAYNRKNNGGDYYDYGGLWRSTDYGATWTKINSEELVNAYSGSDVVLIGSEKILYATLGGWIYRSNDAGATWRKLSNGLPRINDYNRIVMKQDPYDSERIIAVFGTFQGDGLKGIYVTTNGGTTWSEMDKPPRLPSTYYNSYLWRQAWYDNVIGINPFNTNQIYFGGVELIRTTDNGNTWEQLTYWHEDYGTPFVHPDYHVITFHPENPGTIYVGNDGGIWKTTDGGVTWRPMNNGLEVTQFYGGAVSPEGENYQGGTQDNGHLKYVGGTMWDMVVKGDGGYAAINPADPAVAYEEYAFLYMRKTTDDGETWTACVNGLSDASSRSKCLFIAPFALNTDNPDVLIAGSDKIWITTNGAENWTNSSDELSQGEKVSAVTIFGEEAPYTGYAGTTDGKIFVCDNLIGENDTWNEITPQGNNECWVRRVVVDKNNPERIYACYSGYNNDGIFPSKHVWFTENGGETWSDISGDLPDVPVHTLLINPNDENNLFVGTETGVYETTNNGESWLKVTEGIPDYVPVDELVLQTETNKIFAFTHGRGVFVTQLPVSVEISMFNAVNENDAINLYWNTVNESDLKGFEIQRKTESETEWRKIGYVESKSGTGRNNSYEFTDTQNFAGIVSYRLKMINADGGFSFSKTVYVETGKIERFELLQNYPNPFNPVTTIEFRTPHKCTVELIVFNSLGEKIAVLVNGEVNPGNTQVKWNAENMPSGVYFYAAKISEGNKTYYLKRKMLLMK